MAVSNELTTKPKSKLDKIDAILIFGLSLSLYLYLLFNSRIYSSILLGQDRYSSPNSGLDVLTILTFFALLLVTLVLNRRKVFGVLSWIALLLIFILPIFYISTFPPINQWTVENTSKLVSLLWSLWMVIYLGYLTLHVLTHGIIVIFKRDRPIFTKAGVKNFLYVALSFFLISWLGRALISTINTAFR